MDEPFPLDHVGVAVASIAEMRALHESLTGAPCSPVLEVPDQGVNVAFVGTIELLEPRGADTPVGRFLARRGPGLHHLAYRVPDLEAAIVRLESRGLRAIAPGPRRGARGDRIAFLHPEGAGGVLIELVEDPEGRAPAGED